MEWDSNAEIAGNSRLHYAEAVFEQWVRIIEQQHTPLPPVVLDGNQLGYGDVIAVSLRGTEARLSREPGVLRRVDRSVEFLNRELEAGHVVYGVNTGFGGSADTRTGNFELLQSAAIQHLNVGILLPGDKGQTPASSGHGPNAHPELLRSHALPAPIVRAMMLIRCNSLMRGHSGVRMEVLEAVMQLLRNNMTPVVPLRGSISASGDLSTLSYIAGAIEGNPDVFVRVGPAAGNGNGARYLPAHEALQEAGIQPIQLQAKEGLGLTNGTAASCATACFAIHEAHRLALLTQLLTAMATEALSGTASNYDPFISAVRPHAGQSEAAACIRGLLRDSQLASADGKPGRVGLAQDRYALRTAPQWIGPQLEDLGLAARQIAAELNSTTDNPLIDAAEGGEGEGEGRIHHGGNFQAASVTSAMEKTTSALQNLGRLLHAQCAELINNATSKGLPPNLSADDPSTSFTCKGFDVNMAAYLAELAYLAHPVSTHVQPAEMANQSVNSMALVAARYALEAAEVVSLMAATYVYVLCQALDLRALRLELGKTAFPGLVAAAASKLGSPDETLNRKVAQVILDKWDQLAHLDNSERGRAAVREALGSVLEIVFRPPSRDPSYEDIRTFQDFAAKALSEWHATVREGFFDRPTTDGYISSASNLVYQFVRTKLGIPMHRGVVDHPTLSSGRKMILGTMASQIYLAIRNGDLDAGIMSLFEKIKF